MWKKATEELPKKYLHFELMDLLDDKGKALRGWWTGYAWDGLNYNNEKIVLWKPSKFSA